MLAVIPLCECCGPNAGLNDFGAIFTNSLTGCSCAGALTTGAGAAAGLAVSVGCLVKKLVNCDCLALVGGSGGFSNLAGSGGGSGSFSGSVALYSICVSLLICFINNRYLV